MSHPNAVPASHNRLSSRRYGSFVLPDGRTQWRLWAPKPRHVELVLYSRDGTPTAHALERDTQDVHQLTLQAEGAGQRYAYRLDDGPERPDPFSLFQPEGPTQPSAVVSPADFSWSDSQWRGVTRDKLIFYELHIGTFTPEGTFDAAIGRLADLKELGITAIEVLPVNQFPGERNWGYDGVNLYAAQNSYGGPAALQRFINAAHQHGLAVILDCVYNHFGPEANFIGEFGPFFTDKYKTPWGNAVNYDGPGSDGVRDFVLDNVRMWLSEFHADGIRLDAVHAIYDLGARHLLRSIKEVAHEIAETTGIPRTVIGESDLNDPRIILDSARGGHGLDAQWADDFHHAAHAFLTGETRGYYADYGPLKQLASTLNNPYLFTWTYSGVRGRKHGAPLPPDICGDRFVICIQNHDQVGNRAYGDRIDWMFKSPAKRRLAAALLLLSPYLPLIFMGEEYGEKRPFPFFCNFCGPEMIEAVRKGRKEEFKDFLGDADDIPLPDAEETFRSAKLTWTWPPRSEHAGMRNLYRDLIAARKTWQPLHDISHREAVLLPDAETGPLMRFTRGKGSDTVTAFFNFADHHQPRPHIPNGQTLLLSTYDERYTNEPFAPTETLRPYEVQVFGPSTLRR